MGDTIGISAGDLVFDPQKDFITEEFTFGGLDLSLGAGTYYLGMAGGSLEWDYALPLLTPSTGLLCTNSHAIRLLPAVILPNGIPYHPTHTQSR